MHLPSIIIWERLYRMADEVERMMDNTDPEYVSLLFDTGHFPHTVEKTHWKW